MATTIHLYTYDGDSTVINKTLGDYREVTGVFRSSFNILQPSIQFSATQIPYSEFKAYNYAYIPDTGKYYYIVNPTVDNTNTYTVVFEEDVLKSAEDIIAEIEGTITSSEDASKYSSAYQTIHNVQPTTEKLEFQDAFNHDGNIIMVAIRGGTEE